jgi:hypothetical protein
VEHVLDTARRLHHGVEVTDVADVVADPVVAQPLTHPVLLGLVTAENANLSGASVEQTSDHRLSE